MKDICIFILTIFGLLITLFIGCICAIRYLILNHDEEELI